MHNRVRTGFLIGVLLLGTWLRFSHLGDMNRMLMFDEAYNAWDALRLLDEPRLTPFLPDNYGRESGWHYWLMLFLPTLGARPFTLRFASAIVGLLTIAVVYKLGLEIGRRRLGFWSAYGLTVLYWHIHLSHLAMRSILLPLVGGLALVWLLRAQRTNARSAWFLGGIWLGLLMYTYYSARLWILYLGPWLLFWWWRNPAQRRGIATVFGLTTLIVIPQLVYAYLQPDLALDRLGDVAVLSTEGIWQNTRLWLGAWVQQGDGNAELNAFGQPILHPFLVPLFVIGLFALPRLGRRRFHSWLVWGLAIVSVIPSIISDYAPHFLRGIGLIVPAALVIGAGVTYVEQRWRHPAVLGVGLALFGLVGWQARQTLTAWQTHPGVETAMEMHINTAVRYVQEEVAAESAVYLAPFSSFHPNIAFLRYALEPRHVGGFSSNQCLIVPDGEAVYVSASTYEPHLDVAMQRWATLESLTQGTMLRSDEPLYEIFQKTTSHVNEQMGETSLFAGELEVSWQISPEKLHVGESVTVTLAFRATQALPQVLKAFVHLYGSPSPYEGGIIWAQADSMLCEPYPSTLWQAHEVVIQGFVVPVTADTPPGEYSLNIGLYEAPAGARLPVMAADANPQHFLEIGRIQVMP